MKYIFDLDDFCDEYNVLPRLLELKKILPGLKVNLFTIPMKTSLELIQETLKHDWIVLIPHGWKHDSNYEFSKLTYAETGQLMSLIPNFQFYQKGFKAPGWQISKEALEVLKNLGYWIAVQYAHGEMEGDVNGPYQPPVPEGMKCYELNRVLPGFTPIHGHTWSCCGNGLEELWPLLIRMEKDSQFIFIEDYINDTHQDISG